MTRHSTPSKTALVPTKTKHHAKSLSATVLLQRDTQLTTFQHKVLSALCQVPRGYVTTYKLLAQHICCRSTQAVGQALKGNPYAPTVPCHRVVAHSRRLGGFFGKTRGPKLIEKKDLLLCEGVVFEIETKKKRYDDGKNKDNSSNLRVANESIFRFDPHADSQKS